jgi:hypothetical protein
MTVSPCLDMATLSIGAYLWIHLHVYTAGGKEGTPQTFTLLMAKMDTLRGWKGREEIG